MSFERKNDYKDFLFSKISTGVGGVMVSIVAFQAVDLGSIPGQRITF